MNNNFTTLDIMCPTNNILQIRVSLISKKTKCNETVNINGDFIEEFNIIFDN